MTLPDSFDSWKFCQPCKGIPLVWRDLRARRSGGAYAIVGLSQTFPRSIVENGNLRPNRAEQSWCAGAIERSVAARLIDGNSTEPVHRAHELHFLFPIQIDQREHLKFAESQQRADHVLILGTRGRLLLCVCTKRIGSAAAKRFVQELSVG